MRHVVVFLVLMSAGASLGADDGWQQCCTDHWLRRVNTPRSSDTTGEKVFAAYTLPTGGIMALPYGLDPGRLPGDAVVQDVSKRHQESIGAPLFIAANVLVDKDYSYDAATYSMYSTVETLNWLTLADPTLISDEDRNSGWRSFIELVTVELVIASDGLLQTRSHLEWAEVLGTVPFTYDPGRFSDPPERQLWDPKHRSDRAFHIAWQGMMRWPSGEGLTVQAGDSEKKPYSATRYKGTQLVSLRFTVPGAETWERWNARRGREDAADEKTRAGQRTK